MHAKGLGSEAAGQKIEDVPALLAAGPRRRTDFEGASAFIDGLDTACNGGVLVGFREWLIVRLGDGNNLAWPELFLRFGFPDSVEARGRGLPAADPDRLVNRLFEVFREFFEERDVVVGLPKIDRRHDAWLHTQPWFRDESD